MTVRPPRRLSLLTDQAVFAEVGFVRVEVAMVVEAHAVRDEDSTPVNSVGR